MPIAALENIDAQSPAFFHDLSKLFQESMDTLPKNNGETSLQDRIQEALFHLNDIDFIKKLAAVIKHYLNITFSEIILEIDPIINAMCSVQFVASTKKTDTGVLVYAKYTDVVQEALRFLDRSNGRYSTPPDPTKVIFNLHLAVAFFIINEYFPDVHFTAENIAAVILHELGHAYDFIERGYRQSTFNGLMDDLTLYDTTTITKEELIGVIQHSKLLLKKAATLQDKEIAYFIKALDGVEKMLASNTHPLNQTDMAYVANYINFLSSFGTSLLYTLHLSERLSIKIPETAEAHTVAERTADGFSARYGAASALLEALQKLHYLQLKYPRQILDLIPASHALGSIKEGLSFGQKLKETFNIIPTLPFGSYDPELKRFQEIINSLYPIFKSPKLSKNLRDYYLSEVEKCQFLIDSWENRATIKYREIIAKALSVLLRFGFAPFRLFTEDLSKQYRELQILTRSYIDNSLYYQSSRIDRLLDK